MMKIRYWCTECKESFKQHFENMDDFNEGGYCPVCNSTELEVEKK